MGRGKKRTHQYYSSEDEDDAFLYKKKKSKKKKYTHVLVFNKISNLQLKITEYNDGCVLHLSKGSRYWCPLRVSDLEVLVARFPEIMQKVNECKEHIMERTGDVIKEDSVNEDQYTFFDSHPPLPKFVNKKKKISSSKSVLVKKRKADEVDSDSTEEMEQTVEKVK